jgi:hypothetical protein
VQKEYLHFVSILSNCLCWIEGAWTEAAVVFLCSRFEQTMKKLNFVV